jgi:hypothetical protein
MAEDDSSKQKSQIPPLVWVPFADQIERFRRRLETNPELAEVPPRAVIREYLRELRKKTLIRHYIAEMDPEGSLPDLFEAREIDSELRVVADLIFLEIDLNSGAVVLPSSRKSRQIMVCEWDSEQWFQDEVRDYLTRERRKAAAATQPAVQISPVISPNISPSISGSGTPSAAAPAALSEQQGVTSETAGPSSAAEAGTEGSDATPSPDTCVGPVEDPITPDAEAADTATDTPEAGLHQQSASEQPTRPPAAAALDSWYTGFVEDWEDPRPPSKTYELNAARDNFPNKYISGRTMLSVRARLAPAGWKKAGPRSKKK